MQVPVRVVTQRPGPLSEQRVRLHRLSAVHCVTQHTRQPVALDLTDLAWYNATNILDSQVLRNIKTTVLNID